jgi:hypothetical protein
MAEHAPIGRARRLCDFADCLVQVRSCNFGPLSPLSLPGPDRLLLSRMRHPASSSSLARGGSCTSLRNESDGFRLFSFSALRRPFPGKAALYGTAAHCDSPRCLHSHSGPRIHFVWSGAEPADVPVLSDGPGWFAAVITQTRRRELPFLRHSSHTPYIWKVWRVVT